MLIIVCFRYTLLILQMKYLDLLCFSAGAKENDNVKKYTAINGHFVAYNVLHTLWIVSWVSSQFWLGEVFLVLNFVHLWPLYLDNKLDRQGCHQSVIAGPLAWTCYGLFMNGAILLDGHSQLSGGEADLCFLAMFCFPISVVLVHNDYSLAYCFTVLFCGESSHQRLRCLSTFSPISSFLIAVSSAMCTLGTRPLTLLASSRISTQDCWHPRCLDIAYCNRPRRYISGHRPRSPSPCGTRKGIQNSK